MNGYLELTAGEVLRIDVEVEDGWTLAGQVRDGLTRAPIAGAEVSSWEFFGKTVRSDGQGFYRLEGVRRRPGTLVARAPGYGRGELPFTEPAQTLDIELVGGLALSGRVLDPQGRPIGDARVSAAGSLFEEGLIRREWTSATCDTSGRFTLRDVRADLALVLFVRAPGRAAVVFPIAPVPVDEHSLELGDLVVGAGASIEGRVLDAAGAAVTEVGVFLRGPAHVSVPGDIGPFVLGRDARTDTEGRFRVASLAAGQWSVRIVVPGGQVLTDTIQLAAGEHRRGLEWRLEGGGRLRGIVLGPDGAGLAGASVKLLPEAGVVGRSHTRSCDERGAFEFEDVPQGPWILHAAPAGDGDDLEPAGAPLLPTALRDLRADGRFVEPRLQRGDGWIEGIVLDAEGQPFPQALVSRDRGDGSLREGVLTDANGRFRIRVASRGSAILRAWPTAALDPADGSLTRLELGLNRRVIDPDTPGAVQRGIRAGATEVQLRLSP